MRLTALFAGAGLNPVEVILRMRELQEKLMVVDGPDELSREAQRNATLLFLSHLRATFASKRVIREYRFDQEAFTWLVGEIEDRFNKVRIFCSAGAACSMIMVLSQESAYSKLKLGGPR